MDAHRRSALKRFRAPRIALSFGVASLLALGACDACGAERVRRPLREDAGSVPDDRGQQRPTPEKVYAPEGLPTGIPTEHARIVPAPASDSDYDNDEPVEARRLVYRVGLRVPPGFGDAPPTLPAPVGELQIDVAAERLRARFTGTGWPVEAGSEVRIRREALGVYVFDADGGRPLPPGHLAAWFEGGEVPHAASVRTRPAAPTEPSAQGDLVCRLLAEWSGQPPDALERRCQEGAPASFRLGPWMAERTADVPVELPRRALRGDHVEPPQPIVDATSRAFLEPSLLSRLMPVQAARPVPAPGANGDTPDRPGEGLRVRNGGRSRVIVTVSAVPIGWVDAGTDGWFVGLAPGAYRVAALRPLGSLAAHPRGVTVPGELAIRAR